MTTHWRTLAAVLGLSTVVLGWHNCNLRGRLARVSSAKHAAQTARDRPARDLAPPSDRDRHPGDADGAGDGDGDGALAPSAARPLRLPGDLPALLARFAPEPGEDMLAYRDRVVPEATRFLRPQRQRVDRNLAAFSDEAGLDDEVVAALHEAADRTAERLRDRVIDGVLSGELLPPYRAATVVTTANAFTAILADYVAEIRGGLSDAQLEVLGASAFDPVDYLLFATRWEEMLGAL